MLRRVVLLAIVLAPTSCIPHGSLQQFMHEAIRHRLLNIPEAQFRKFVREPGVIQWQEVSAAMLFKSKRCVVFSFTRLLDCKQAVHNLGQYEKYYDDIKAFGVDEVYCLSVCNPSQPEVSRKIF